LAAAKPAARRERRILFRRHGPFARSHLMEQSGNPPASIARALGMELRRFSRALHKIKAANDLSGTDRVIIYRDGSVTDAQGEPLGNLHDED
jgi:hypothetical protein